MSKYLKRILLPVSFLVLLLFAIFMVNQTFQIYQLLLAINIWLARTVLYLLLAGYLLLIILPAFYYFRLPKIILPPDDEESAAFEKYLLTLQRRLRKNKHLSGMPLAGRPDIENALNILKGVADGEIKKAATTVFISTSISQSGRLDSFMVLFTLIRLIWRVAQIYYQRPSLRAMVQLYANVAGTAFIAGELDDMDVSRQVEPIITSVLGGSLTGALPGVNMVAGIITNSILVGSANAFLALRVGIISRQYCGSLLKQRSSKIRHSATVEGAKMLSMIVVGSAGNISKAIMNAAMKSPGRFSRDIVRKSWDKLSSLGKNSKIEE